MPWSRISLCIRIRFWMVSRGLPRPYVAMDGVRRPSDTIQTSIKSHFGWCWKVFWHHPLAMYGLRRPSETTQNLILMHKLIWIWGVSESTVYGPQALASLRTWDLIVHGPLLMTSGGPSITGDLFKPVHFRTSPTYCWHLMAIEGHMVGASGSYASYWNAFLS